MIVVLDVSAAIEIIMKKEKKDLFELYLEQSQWVIAPDLYVSEISNVLWKYYKINKINHNECVQYTEDGLALIDDFVESKDLWKEALGEGIKNIHSVYDMFYMVLTRRNDAKLLTSDKVLSEICKRIGVDVAGL